MVPALVFTVAGILVGLIHVPPLPVILLPAAAFGGICLLPMLSGRNEANKRNKHNYTNGCNYGNEKNRNYNGSLYIQLFLFFLL